MISTLDQLARRARLDPQDAILRQRIEANRARVGLKALKKGAIDPDAVLDYVLAGQSVVTLESLKTGQHLTFRVRQNIEEIRDDNGKVVETNRLPLWFVDLMTGSDNTSDFTFVGSIHADREFRLSRKSEFKASDPAILAFCFMLRHARAHTQAPNLAVWHDGRCGRCRRLLTVPSSLETGIGPVCETKEKVGRRAKLKAKTEKQGRKDFERLFLQLQRGA